MKASTLFVFFLVVLSCNNKNVEQASDSSTNTKPTFQKALREASLPITEEDISYLDSVLNNETLTDYYKEYKDTILDVDFDLHAYKYWKNIGDLNMLDSIPFTFNISEEIQLSTIVTSIENTQNEYLVTVQMFPKDGSGWSCGTCPGITFILKYISKNSKFILDGTTGRVPYSFKYGRGLTNWVHVDREKNPYLLVTTDAGGIGQGREGVTIYSMEPFGNILYSKIFINGYRGVYFLPQDYHRIKWVFNALNKDTNMVKAREIHISADLELEYSLNSNLDSLSVDRTGSIDYHIYYRDALDNKRYFEDTIHSIQYRCLLPR